MARAGTSLVSSILVGDTADRIGALTHSSGTITLAASKLTIGGVQVVTSSLGVSVGSPAANTLYFLYVVDAGTPTLVQSTNVNSVGPAGQPAWKLVGAYYSNGLSTPAFGSFCTIDGWPSTGEIVQASITHYGSGSNPTKPTGNPDWATWERDGDKIIYKYAYNATGAGSGGSGNWYWPTPTNLLIDIARISNLGAGASASDQLGEGRWGNAGIAYGGHVYCASNNRIGLISWQTGGALTIAMGSSANVVATSAHYGGFLARLPIVGMSATPLKDL